MREAIDGGPEVSLRSTTGYWMSSLRDGEEESVLRPRIWDMGIWDMGIWGYGDMRIWDMGIWKMGEGI